MNYHIEIENLGAIEKAEFDINPMTILAGKNGTGKSFVTKFLYSVLKVFKEDLYLTQLDDITYNLATNFTVLMTLINNDFKHKNILTIVEQCAKLSMDLRKIILKDPYLSIEILEEIETIFLNDIKQSLEDIVISKKKEETNLSIKNMSIRIDLIKDAILDDIQLLSTSLHNKKEYQDKLIGKHLFNELKENFQISQLKELIRYGQEKLLFSIKDSVEIIIEKNSLILNTLSENEVDKIKEFHKLVFFESPVYWKLLSLINESIHNDEILTGVPQHFHDLKKLVFANFKNGERPQFIIDCASNLEQSLQGKFRTTLGSDLVFENKQGQAIDKSLVSFGMTNLGILQAVLNKNIINKGSFIFIDEPESNLHPEWQTLLAETLVYLAKNGVYVIITSHSTDMLKAFDVATQEQKLQDKLSAHYFQMDGTLLEMNDEHLTDIEQARQKLMENYDDLTMRGYLL